MGTLTDRVALVTGGGDGIGYGIVRKLAAAGAAVVIAEVDAAAGAAAAAAVRDDFGVAAIATTTDVTDREQLEAAVALGPAEFGRLDILVNNAWGGGSMARLEYKTDADIEHGLSMALWPAFGRCAPPSRTSRRTVSVASSTSAHSTA